MTLTKQQFLVLCQLGSIAVTAAGCSGKSLQQRTSGLPSKVGIDSSRAVQIARESISPAAGPLAVHCFKRVEGGVAITFVPAKLGPNEVVTDGYMLVTVTDSGRVVRH